MKKRIYKSKKYSFFREIPTMNLKFRTENYSFEYTENNIKDTVVSERHCHSRFELIFVLSGNVKAVVEGTPYFLSSDHAIMIPPLSYHTVTSKKNGFYERIIVLFDKKAIPKILRSELVNGFSRGVVFSSKQTEDLKRICKTGKFDPFYEPLAESAMIRAMYETIRSKDETATDNTCRILNRSISYINDHIYEKIRLKDITAHAMCSQSTVSHLFAEQIGTSPKQYIIQKKLALAKQLIRDGTPPTAAALKIGYDNYSDFYRLYMKYNQKTPSDGKNG